MATLTVRSNASDGRVGAQAQTFAAARATTADVGWSNDGYICPYSYNDGWFWVIRNLMFVDTSTVPAGSQTASASARMTCVGAYGNGEDAHFVTTTNTAWDLQSFNIARYGSVSKGLLPAVTGGDSVADITQFPFNYGGMTVLGVRGNDDMTNTVDWGVEATDYASGAWGVGSQRPLFTITYVEAPTFRPRRQRIANLGGF